MDDFYFNYPPIFQKTKVNPSFSYGNMEIGVTFPDRSERLGDQS